MASNEDDVRAPRIRSSEGISLIEYIKELHEQNQEMIEKLEAHLREMEKRVLSVERVIWGLGGAWVLAQILIHFINKI